MEFVLDAEEQMFVLVVKAVVEIGLMRNLFVQPAMVVENATTPKTQRKSS